MQCHDLAHLLCLPFANVRVQFFTLAIGGMCTLLNNSGTVLYPGDMLEWCFYNQKAYSSAGSKGVRGNSNPRRITVKIATTASERVIGRAVRAHQTSTPCIWPRVLNPTMPLTSSRSQSRARPSTSSSSRARAPHCGLRSCFGYSFGVWRWVKAMAVRVGVCLTCERVSYSLSS